MKSSPVLWKAILLVVLIAAPTAGQSQLTAIKAGHLVDPENGTTLADQIILVDSGKIKAVGSGIAIPEGAAVIDLSGSSVLPGLFDCHTHMCLWTEKSRDFGNYYFTTLLNTNAYRAIQGVVNVRQVLEAGFTTIRDVGNSGNYIDTDLRLAIERGIIPGPTIINAGRIIAPYGGQFFLQPERRELADPEYFFADTKDELKKAIRENIHYGARVIKIVVDDQRYIYSTDDLKFAVQEAGKAGMKVAAHCGTHEGAHNAVEAGVASIEHGMAMTDEDLKLARENNVVLVGTDFPERLAQEFIESDTAAHSFHARIIDRLKRAYKAGVTMAFGTDVFFPMKGETRGSLAISYIESFIEAGIPANVILQSMTTNAARLLGVEKARGSIKPGLAADIIATPENPLDNIQTLKGVSFVMKNGKVIKQTK